MRFTCETSVSALHVNAFACGMVRVDLVPSTFTAVLNSSSRSHQSCFLQKPTTFEGVSNSIPFIQDGEEEGGRSSGYYAQGKPTFS